MPSSTLAGRAPGLLAGVAAAFLVLTIYSWFIPEPGPNELSRVDLTFALARRATTSIDAYAANTIDRAEYDGRYYSDKPLGLPLLAAPVLKVADRVLRLGDLGEIRVSYVAHLLTVATVAFPAALLCPLLVLVAQRLGASTFASAASGAAMALGTALLPFATTFYAHATSAALGFLAFALGVGVLVRGRPGLAAFLAGLAAGLAALVEYPVILVGAIVFLVRLAHREPPRRQALYLLGGAIALAPLPVYNALSFGAPWRLGYGFVSQQAFGGMSAGFFGLTRPRLDALAEIAIGPAGLLTQSPWVAGGLLGLALWWRTGARPIAAGAAAIVGAFVLYNASYYLPMGGQSSGPRFLLPALPFLALGLAFLPGWSWGMLGPVAAWSFVQMLAIAAVEPKTGPGHPDPFWTYWWPRLISGDVALSWVELRLGLHGAAAVLPMVLPLALGVLLLIGLSLAHAAPAGVRRTLRWHPLPAGLTCLVAIGTWAYLVAPIGVGGVPERFRSSVAAAPAQIGVVYGETVELVGYRGPSQVAPGEVVDLVLYWRARAPIRENLTAFVHLVGRDGANLSGYDGPPVGAGFPTNLWPVGTLLRAPYRLRVDAGAPAPTALRVVAGMYGPGDMGLLPARDPAGQPIDPGPSVAQIALTRGGPAVVPQPRAEFEGGLQLLDWTLPPATFPGGSTTGALRWRAGARPARDATVFVQALGPAGPIAQWDAQPLGGQYPTSLWPPGEVVEDRFILTVRGGSPAGDYPLIVGLYVLPEVRRLPTGGRDYVEIGRLRVEP